MKQHLLISTPTTTWHSSPAVAYFAYLSTVAYSTPQCTTSTHSACIDGHLAMAGTQIHYGPYDAIPATASPGLLFLKNLLPALDSLGPFDAHGEPIGQPALIQFLAPGATFVMNGGPPIQAVDVLQMLPKRSERLSRFHHDVRVAWDIAAGDGSGKRTVMYESTSISTFKADPEAVQVKVAEFNIVELVPTTDPTTGEATLKAVQLRAFLDGAPVTSRAQLIAKE